MHKTSLSKKITAMLLAAVMVFSALPVVAFAATGPVQQSAGDQASVVDRGKYVAIGINYQNFTFIQTEDDQEFTFTVQIGAKKNAGVNYGYVAAPNAADHPFTFTQPLGKSYSLSGDEIGGLPGNLFGGNDVVYRDLTVTFVADGGKTYETALRVQYDSGSTSGTDRAWRTHDIPMTITVLDKRALNTAINAANAAAADQQYYTTDSWNAVSTALANAESVAGNVVTDQGTIDNYTSALDNAVKALAYQPANKTALAAALEAAAAVYPDRESTYTPDSWAPFAAAYEAAAALNANTALNIKNQGEIDAAAQTLNDTFGKLVQESSFYSPEELNALIGEKQALYDENSEFMTEESATALAEALANANAAAEAAAAGDDSLIDDAYTALEAVVVAYAPADYEALKAALEAATAFLERSDVSNYDDVKVASLREAVATAEAIEDGLDKRSQAMIDEATEALTSSLPTEDDLKDADYDEFNALLAQAEAFLADTDSLQYYDEADVAALQAAVDAAREVLPEQKITYQPTIDAAAEGLAQTMLDESDMTRANTTALSEALTAANEWMAGVDLKNYDDEAVAALTAAVEAGQTLLDSNPAVIYQDDVDTAAQAITDAMLTDEDLKPANYDTFNALLEQAKALLDDETTYVNYNADAVAALQTAVDAAAAVEPGQNILYQPTIDAAAQAIADAMLTDEDLNPADYTTFSALLEQAKALLDDETTVANYEADAIAALQAAYDDAVANVQYDMNILYQPTLDGYAQALSDAMLTDEDLKPAELADLEAAIAAGEAALDAEGSRDNTLESLNVLRSALYVAEGLRDGHTTILDQAAVNAAAAEIYAAIDGLTLKPADYAGLEQAIAAAEANYDALVASGNYEDSALQAYAAAIETAKQVNADRAYNIREQAQVDAAVATLNAAAPDDSDLKPADLTDLNAAIANAEAIMAAADYSEYTEYTRRAMEAALADARLLAASAPTILQQLEVAHAAAMLNDAAAALIKAEANYDALDAAVAQAEALLADTTLADRYTNASIAALQAAVDAAKAIDRHLPAEQQTAVDDAAQAVTDALNGLDAYSKVTDVQITDANGNVLDGNVYYVKADWWDALYSNVSTDLGVQFNTGADVASITWEYANWSIDEPEANIDDHGDGTATIAPNGKGIGARSCWVKVTVTDVNGNTASDIIKVRFYKWNWQK